VLKRPKEYEPIAEDEAKQIRAEMRASAEKVLVDPEAAEEKKESAKAILADIEAAEGKATNSAG
jgi:hypothetical protein